MDFNLDADQQRRFTALIQNHRRRLGLAQWKVAEAIQLGGDLSSEISRFENAHINVVTRWLTEPYLSAVAAAYGFVDTAALLDIFEQARHGIVAPAADPWHSAFPGVAQADMEVARVYTLYTLPHWLISDQRGGPETVVGGLPADAERITVVMDGASGVGAVKRQVLAAWAAKHPLARLPDLLVVDSATLRELPTPAVYVEDWSVDLLLVLVRRLVEFGQLRAHEAERVERMLAQAPPHSVAGLPMSLIVDAIAAEARAEGPAGNLHMRLVSAEWDRAVRVPVGAAFAAADRSLYTDFWAEVAVSSGAADWSDVSGTIATQAAARVLDQRQWHAPDGAELGRRIQQAGEIASVPKRKAKLDEVAMDLQRPGASRLVELFVQMGLLRRRADRVHAASTAVATLAAAWGLAERPDCLAPHPSVLTLPSAGRLFADIAAFRGNPGAVWRALGSVPAWAASDRDHAWLRFAAATPDIDGVRGSDLVAPWARVVYERSGSGRWIERIWTNRQAARELDIALRSVSERFRADLPVVASVDVLLDLVPVSERVRIDGEVAHPTVEDPVDAARCLESVAQVAPWQCPVLTCAQLDSFDDPRYFRPGRWPRPDGREVIASAADNGFAPALALLAGEVGDDSMFDRLSMAARLVCIARGNAGEGMLARAREEALWCMRQGGAAADALHLPIRLIAEQLPVLDTLLGLDRKPVTLWEVAVIIVRRTGGIPPRSAGFSPQALTDEVRVKLADALGDVAELSAIESTVDERLRGGRVATHAGLVTAFGAEMRSSEQRYHIPKVEPFEHPLRQLAGSLSAADLAGHDAAVALFRRGEEAPLRRRARGAVPPMRSETARSWLDAWRLADLWDAPLERVRAALPAEDTTVLLDAVAGSEWGSDPRACAFRDANTLQRLGIERPDLVALAEAFSRLRLCGAAAPVRREINELQLPMDDRLSAFCDRLRGEAPADLDLHRFYEERASRALRALAEAADEATLRAWDQTYREESRVVCDPTEPFADPARSQGDVQRVGSSSEFRVDAVMRAVGTALKDNAGLRAAAWRVAQEPGACEQLLTWALDAGEPYPTWVLRAIDRAAASGQGWPRWLNLPAFRRQRLTWMRSRRPSDAASLMCISFEEISRDGPDDVVVDAAGVVLDWLQDAAEPLQPRRRIVLERPRSPAVAEEVDASQVGPPAEEPDPGPPWNELARFFQAAIRDRRVPRARVVAAVESLWDLIVAAPITHDTSLVDGEPVHLQIHEGSRDVFDDLARLLLLADAPGRIERLLREGVSARDGDDAGTIGSAVSAGLFPMLAGLPRGMRRPRTRAEVLQMRVLARFPPPSLDPRWFLVSGGLFEDWAWGLLASRGDPAALDRLVTRLQHTDIAEPGWTGDEPVLSALIHHRREDVVRWLMAQAMRSPEHAVEARAVVVGWVDGWGDWSAALAAWARGGPEPDPAR